MLELQPLLNGSLVKLRPTTEADRYPLFEVASDPLLWLLHPAHDRWQRSVFDHFFDSGLKSGGSLTIVDRESARVIGASRYDNYKIERDEIEIGWTYIGRAYWGGIYNGQIKQLMLDHIFRQVGTVAFTVGTTNLRSRRALEKLGATLRDETTSRLMAGKSVEHVIYEIRRTVSTAG